MNHFRLLASVAVTAAGAVVLTACSGPSMTMSLAPQPAAEPASIRAEQLVGRWGYGAYYKDKDAARTQAAARAECSRPVNITRGPGGGIMMPMVNQAQQELSLKGGPGGKDYIGAPGEAGVEGDSEIVSFDGKVLITRTVATDEAGHATSVYVRCGGARKPQAAAAAAIDPIMAEPAGYPR